MPIGRRGDEFDAVSSSLNATLDRIAPLLENLQQVSSDLAPDLRTPLVRMRSGLQRALGDQVMRRKAIEGALRQSDGLLDLFAAILRIAEVESGELVKLFEAIDLAAFVQDVCDSWESAVVDGERRLRCSTDQSIVVAADKQLLAPAIINLLKDALVHTSTGTTITIGMEHDERSARLIFADDGPGVAAADHDRIVRRFARLDASQTTPGNGLGINLVSAIATTHGGVVAFSDNEPGLRMTITLPRLLDR